MESGVFSAAMAAIGAMAGAGLASGQEISSFFSRYGAWGWAGIISAMGAMLMLGLLASRDPALPRRRILLSALLLCTGSAMISGAGEIAALTLPLRPARVMGVAVAAGIALLLRKQDGRWLSFLSRCLAALLLGTMAAGYLLPARAGTLVREIRPFEALVRGACYGGFNMPLALPGLCAAMQGMSCRARRQCTLLISGVMTLLLCAGHGLMLRHSALLCTDMPFVQLMAGWGKAGYYLVAATMFLACLTSASSALCALYKLWPGHMFIPTLAMLLCAPLGFSSLVENAYPILGAGCLGILTLQFLHSRREKRMTDFPLRKEYDIIS